MDNYFMIPSILIKFAFDTMNFNMYLKELSLINFKNYKESHLEFDDKITCFVGNNGVGKTNILDAIYYLSFCKSYFNIIDSQNINHRGDFFVIQGIYMRNEKQENVYCGVQKNQKKKFKFNNKEYTKLADHIGLFPLVIISPADYELIAAGSDERRKYIDSVISQFDKSYLEDLLSYNKALAQRNILLKKFSESGIFDAISLEIWNEQLVEYGQRIYNKRNVFLEDFLPVFNSYYTFISGDREYTSIEYDSQLKDNNFKGLLINSVERDRILKYTTTGIHKDDLIFKIGDYPIKKFGSQGQQKSFIIALKLAQFEYTKELKQYNPILLFDDIFDKLDDIRVEKLMELVSNNSFGQVFVTDAHPERIKKVFDLIDENCTIVEVVDGSIKDIKKLK